MSKAAIKLLDAMAKHRNRGDACDERADARGDTASGHRSRQAADAAWGQYEAAEAKLRKLLDAL